MNNRNSKKEMVYITTAFERWVHWWLAGTCIYLFLTGIGFMFHSFAFIPTFIGGHLIPKYAHNYAGIVYFIAALLGIVVWFKDAGKFYAYDIEWLRRGGGYLTPVDDLPEAGKYNAGQKLFFVIVAFSGFYMFVTGIIMWFPLGFPKPLVRLCYLLHATGAMVMGSAIIFHGFLGTFANTGSVSSMMHGWVTKAWLKTQHGRYYKELEEKGLL
jgi:formate dehydrogenase subunit gamma